MMKFLVVAALVVGIAYTILSGGMVSGISDATKAANGRAVEMKIIMDSIN